MSTGEKLRSRASMAALLTLGMWGGIAAPSLAQSASTTPSTSNDDEIVVTGSYIRGTPEDAALPVDVISAQSLQDQGSPTILQLVKTITASTSGLGESNRYNGGAGTATINLRGFGASRTLVLMNGRRLAESTQAAFQGGGADLNFIPTAAIGRIEILKDGAAATYGSDAVGGVVNFITRRDLDGFDVSTEYSAIQGSDGDFNTDLAWGMRNDRGNILLTFGYRHRSALDIHERDFALRSYQSPFFGGWSGATNPTAILGPNGANFGSGAIRDNGCEELGGQLTNTLTQPVRLGGTTTVDGASIAAAAQSATCRFQFSNFNDLVNQEDHFQLYGEANYELTDKLDLHFEAAWNRNDVPEQLISPSNLTTQYPTPLGAGGTSGATSAPGLNGQVNYFVPFNNPGLVDLYTTCAAPLTLAQCGDMSAATGVSFSKTGFRPVAFNGKPGGLRGADVQSIRSDSFRLSGGLSGDIGESGLHFDTALTFMETQSVVGTNDILVNNLSNALRGYGSSATNADKCTVAEMANPANQGNSSVGCYWYNPFTNGVAVSAVSHAANPYYRGNANPAVINQPGVIDALYGHYDTTITNRIFVADAVVDGGTGITLGGGDIAWALGGSLRYDQSIGDYSRYGNIDYSPCVDSVDDGVPTCSNPVGPLEFFGANSNFNVDRWVSALFGEVNFPILDNLEVTAAIRYERYGGGIGDTTNPKVSFRWQPIEWLAFRGSAGSTFRAPSQLIVTPGSSKGVANLGGQYRAVSTVNNPALQPETADTYSLGFIVELGGFQATVDYYHFSFEDQITLESSSAVYNAAFATGAPQCAADPALLARFVFNGACASGGSTVLQTTINWVNGPPVETSGFDIRAQYDWDDFLGWGGTHVQIGAEATILEKYAVDRFPLLGAPGVTLRAAEDLVGRHELLSAFYSYPEDRANVWFSLERGPFHARWQTTYRSGTEGSSGQPTTYFRQTGANTYVTTPLGQSEDFVQHDVFFRFDFPGDAVFSLSIENLTDEDPPLVASNYNYDYTTGNPLGRVFEVGFNKRF